MPGGLNLWEWLGIVDLDNESIIAKGDFELLQNSDAFDALMVQIARVATANAQEAMRIQSGFVDSHNLLADTYDSLAAITPRNNDAPTEPTKKAWEVFFKACDVFQTTCDDTSNDLERGMDIKETAASVQAYKDEIANTLKGASDALTLPTWLKALAIITGVAVVSLAVAYTVGKVKG